MERYIDAEKLKERLMVGSELDPEPCKGFRSALLAMVDTQEDADVVEVVRCKNCKWFNEIGCAIRIVDESDKPKENGFCSFGERRE